MLHGLINRISRSRYRNHGVTYVDLDISGIRSSSIEPSKIRRRLET